MVYRYANCVAGFQRFRPVPEPLGSLPGEIVSTHASLRTEPIGAARYETDDTYAVRMKHLLPLIAFLAAGALWGAVLGSYLVATAPYVTQRRTFRTWVTRRDTVVSTLLQGGLASDQSLARRTNLLDRLLARSAGRIHDHPQHRAVVAARSNSARQSDPLTSRWHITNVHAGKEDQWTSRFGGS